MTRIPMFTVANSNSFFQSLGKSSDSSKKKKQNKKKKKKKQQIFKDILGSFLFYHENICYVYSLESPHRGDSNEYT